MGIGAELIAVWALKAFREEEERQHVMVDRRPLNTIQAELIERHSISQEDLERGMRFLMERRFVTVVQHEGKKIVGTTVAGQDWLRSEKARLLPQRLKALMKVQHRLREQDCPVARACGLTQEELATLANEGLIQVVFFKDEGPDLDRYRVETILPEGHSILSNAHVDELSAPPETNSDLLLFISHSARDQALAKALVELLRSALNIPPDQIRCSSVNGYRFPGGASVDDELRREVQSSKAFIALVTPSSIKSVYVLFELAGRWHGKLHLLPILGAGAGPEVLEGPLKALNALSCDDPAQVHQMIDELATVLDITQRIKVSAYYDGTLKLVAASKRGGVSASGQDGADKGAADAELPPPGEAAGESLPEAFMRSVSSGVSRAGQRARAVNCVNNLKQIGLAARTWALDHGDVLPASFQEMQLELGTSKILKCPAGNGSEYRILSPGASTAEPSLVYGHCPVHNHVLLTDGSVQKLGARRIAVKDGKWRMPR